MIITNVRDSTTTRCVPTAPAVAAQGSLLIVPDEDEVALEPYQTLLLSHPTQSLPPKGTTIVPDLIEIYYKLLGPNEAPNIDRLTVAKESTAIQSISALVDNMQKKECTVDPGCQVIAMSETACHSLALAYDPWIRLNMESANGSFDWLLSLACKVPFLIGPIMLYLQVHVIHSPSYEILLG